MADLVTDVLQTTVQPTSDTANHLGSVHSAPTELNSSSTVNSRIVIHMGDSDVISIHPSMPAGFRRHLVGKTLRNVCYPCDIA